MKFVGVFLALVAFFDPISAILSGGEFKEGADYLDYQQDERVAPEPSPEEMARYAIAPSGESRRCRWPGVWWTTPPPGLCDCYNRDLAPKCQWPGTWYPRPRCYCDCPWWAHLVCQKNQYLDPKTCTCQCREPCRDCSSPQVWNNNSCTCNCPKPVSCLKPRFYNYWSCQCECKQKPRRCCQGTRLWKVWSEKACDCVCAKPMRCRPGYTWDTYLCKCVKQYQVWWALDFAAESAKREEGVDDYDGVEPELIHDPLPVTDAESAEYPERRSRKQMPVDEVQLPVTDGVEILA